MKKICVICNNEFKTRNPNALYCNQQCRDKDLTRVCKYCESEFKVEKRSRKTIYCSKSCAVAQCNKDGKMGKNAPKNKGKHTHLKICEQCKKEYKVSDSVSENNKKFFCCKKCYLDNVRSSLENKNCKNCGKEMFVGWKENIFCSQKCRAEYQHENNVSKLECKYCKKEFYRRNGNITQNQKGVFCSKFCERSFRLRKSISIEKYGNNYVAFRKKISKMSEYGQWREKVIEKYNGECAICSSTENLEVHHIIPLFYIAESITHGIYNNETLVHTLLDPLFNNVNNGIALCRGCHNLSHGK